MTITIKLHPPTREVLGWVTVDSLPPVLITRLIRTLQVKLGHVGEGQLDALRGDGAEGVGGSAMIFPSVVNLWGMRLVCLEGKEGDYKMEDRSKLASYNSGDEREREREEER